MFPMSVWMRSTRRLPQTHRHQHKHTHSHWIRSRAMRSPIPAPHPPTPPPPELSPSVRHLANHRASVDRAPRGPSNPADVASVGQQQNTAWWDECREDDWHGSACPAAPPPAKLTQRRPTASSTRVSRFYIYLFIFSELHLTPARALGNLQRSL